MQTTHDTLQQLRTSQLKGIKRLDLNCGLIEFPPEILELADSLEILNLSNNQLASLPDDLHRLHKLRIVFCSDNLFTELPGVLGQCKNLQMIGFRSNQIAHVPAAALPPGLRWLVLTDNHIESLPESIGTCLHLQKVALAGNQLRALPDTMAQCRQLELLRISANQLSALPPWLLALPRLSWLAYAGNPLTAAKAGGVATSAIAWTSLTLQGKLGEGASGVIYQAAWQRDASHESVHVAVKIFKGAVTSDGWPENELAAARAAGSHPHLIGLLGELTGHPESRKGLVMPLIPQNFATLAAPPSLNSCTRDVYAAEDCFSIKKIIRIALAAAQAAAHLHSCNLLHGDLYAHNLQCDADGHALLGDMGAASVLPDDAETSPALQRIEVRAFGCLLEELLAHRTGEDAQAADALVCLRDACLDDPDRRSIFQSIVDSLLQIQTKSG